jgi:hypothetical protein
MRRKGGRVRLGSDREQPRAKQHKAGCGYREESIGHEVIITHGAPAARECWSPSRRTVKGISNGSDGNLTDALEQQRRP